MIDVIKFFLFCINIPTLIYTIMRWILVNQKDTEKVNIHLNT